jgi:hypothetical protein
VKTIGQFFTAAMLTLVLTASALAGDMYTPARVFAPPPPPDEINTPGRIENNPAIACDALTEVALLLYRKMLLII